MVDSSTHTHDTKKVRHLIPTNFPNNKRLVKRLTLANAKDACTTNGNKQATLSLLRTAPRRRHPTLLPKAQRFSKTSKRRRTLTKLVKTLINHKEEE